MLKRAKQNSLVQDVIAQIETAILERQFKPGDKLPSPSDLQTDLQVSRGTLREALRVLEQKRLIKIRPGVGGGAIVQSVTTDPMSEGLALLIRHQKVAIEHIAEFREGAEADVAALAAKRATEEGIEKLKTLYEIAKSHLAQGSLGYDVFIRTDEQFHLELANISGNPVYISVLQTIHENIHRYYQQYLPMEETVLEENLKDLEGLTQAVSKHQANKARRIAKGHVQRFFERMKQIKNAS